MGAFFASRQEPRTAGRSLPHEISGRSTRKWVSASKPKLLAMSPARSQPQQRGDQFVDLFARVVERQ